MPLVEAAFDFEAFDEAFQLAAVVAVDIPPGPHPEGIFELSLTDPEEAPVWLDVSDYVRRFAFTRGRSTELDQVQAGVATVLLDNRDGRFDPTNVLGPYYPDVVPMRRFRIRTQMDLGDVPFVEGESYVGGTDVLQGSVHEMTLFTGFVEGWPQSWPGTGFDAVVTITVSDGFKPLSLDDFVWGFISTGADPDQVVICGKGSGDLVPDAGPPFIPDDLAGARIERVLDCIGWSAEDRDIDPGTVTIWGSDVSVGGVTNIRVETGALQHILDVTATEGGGVFIDKGGRLRFIDRDHDTVLGEEVWGDIPGERRYHDIVTSSDDSQLWNDITVDAGELVAPGTAEDTDSIDRYYRRKKSVTALPTSPAVLSARADGLLSRYAEPKIRIVTLQPKGSTAQDWVTILSKELGDKTAVRVRPPGSGGIQQLSRIENIAVTGQSKFDWRITWGLSGLPGGLSHLADEGEGWDFDTWDESTWDVSSETFGGGTFGGGTFG